MGGGLHKLAGVCIQGRGSAYRGEGVCIKEGSMHPGKGVCMQTEVGQTPAPSAPKLGKRAVRILFECFLFINSTFTKA